MIEVNAGPRNGIWSGGRNQGGLPVSGGIQAESPRVIGRWMIWQEWEGKKASRNDNSGCTWVAMDMGDSPTLAPLFSIVSIKSIYRFYNKNIF